MFLEKRKEDLRPAPCEFVKREKKRNSKRRFLPHRVVLRKKREKKDFGDGALHPAFTKKGGGKKGNGSLLHLSRQSVEKGGRRIDDSQHRLHVP